MTQDIILYTGTYTRHISHVPESKGEGIHRFRLNQETGELTAIGVTEGVDNPSFLAIDPGGKYLYAGSEVAGWHEGLVTAFAIDSETGDLHYLNKQSAMGSITAHVSVAHDSSYVFVANYMSQQSIAMFPIQADGSLAPASSTHQHTLPVRGTVPSRQEKPHSHCILPSPDGRFVFVCDLGLDKVMVYQVDDENQQLIPNSTPYFDTAPGAGPRHLIFHPSGQVAYVAQELNSTVSVLSFDPVNATLEHRQTVSTIPADYSDFNSVSAIHVSANGRFAYASNRGHNSIIIYEIDQDSYQLSPIGYQSTAGKTPRSFVIDPSGEFLLVGNQDSHDIVSFRIDKTTGMLTQVATTACPTPVCLRMLILNKA